MDKVIIAEVYVYDNNGEDKPRQTFILGAFRSEEAAEEAGAAYIAALPHEGCVRGRLFARTPELGIDVVIRGWEVV